MSTTGNSGGPASHGSTSPGRRFTLRLQMPADDEALAEFLAAQGPRNQGQAVLQLIHMWINEFGTVNVMERCLQGLTLGALRGPAAGSDPGQSAQSVLAPAGPALQSQPRQQAEPELEPESAPEPEDEAEFESEADAEVAADAEEPAAPAAPATQPRQSPSRAAADLGDEPVDDMFGSLRNS